MRIYSVEFTPKSPLIITSNTIGNVLSHQGDYIKGSTIRGGFLTQFRRLGYNIESESREPKLIFHPAFPLVDGKVIEPSDPFIYKCKVCKEIERIDPYGIDPNNPLENIPYICKNGHPFTLKSEGGKTGKGHNRYITLTSVGLNKALESSEINMLYTYSALAPNTRFKGLVIDNDNQRLDIGKVKRIYIGKGISRGFGVVDLEIKDITDDHIKNRSNIIRNTLSKTYIILKALSPLYLTSYPTIDGCRYIKCLKTGYSYVSGYSIAGNMPKVMLKCIKEGSLIYLEHNNTDIVNRLVELELNGIGPFSSVGINIVKVLS